MAIHVSIINQPKELYINIKKLEGEDYIQKIEEKSIIEELEISSSILDSKGDKWQNWSQNSLRGGEKYIPPNGWNGIGLNIENIYENNNWLSNKNIEGEFAVAYLGIGNILDDKEQLIEDLNKYSIDIKKMMSQKLYADEKDIRHNNDICGDGVCLFQNPEYAENSAGIVDVCGFRIKIILMCRVNPKKIRQPENFPECWILNPIPEEIRPYRILIKKIPCSPLTGAIKNTIIVSKAPIDYITSAIKSKDLSFLNIRKDENFEFCSKLNEQLVSDDFFVIRLYSSVYFGFINEYLRNGKVLNTFRGIEGFSEKQIRSWVYCLQQALSRNKNVEEGTIVYRGVMFPFPKDIGIGSKFYFREFISTSTRKDFCEEWIDYQGTIMEIKIKNNGINGYPNYCYYIEDITISEEQYEVLISSHCYFTVTNIKHENKIDYISLICEGNIINNIQENYFDEITMKYKIERIKTVKILGEVFVIRNKNRCNIVYNNEELELCSHFNLENKILDNDILKIKLRGIKNIKDLDSMFYRCYSLISLPDIHKIKTEEVINMDSMFKGCYNLTYISDISSWNTSKITMMYGMFDYCSSLTSLPDISKWNTKNVSNMTLMFAHCSSLKSLPDISKWDTSNLQNMGCIFLGCNSLVSIPDISKWNISLVKSLEGVFAGCSSIVSLPDISKWDLSNVEIIISLFFGCCSLKSIPDISNWNMTNIKSLNSVFCGCSSLKSLPDISKWNFANLNSLIETFGNCVSLVSLPNIMKWKGSFCTRFEGIFYNCSEYKINQILKDYHDIEAAKTLPSSVPYLQRYKVIDLS